MSDNHPHVYIIDSPKMTDFVGGKSLGETLLTALNAQAPTNGYCRVQTIQDLCGALSVPAVWAERLRADSKLPVLHFCTHGSMHGVQLSDGSLVSWRSLAQLLAPHNNSFPWGVALGFSSCEGAFAASMAAFEGLGAPYYLVVGSLLAVQRDQVANAFANFYYSWPRGYTGRQCVERMRQSSAHPGFEIYFGTEERQKFQQHKHQAMVDAFVRQAG